VERLLEDPELKPHDVAVLSFGSRLSSRQASLSTLGERPCQLADGPPTEGAVLCDTVLRAKGLERPVVVLTDLDRVQPKSRPRALYIALTRASTRCVLVGTPAELAFLLGR
jgi:superfamily I DNA/RNA helicase